MKTIIYDTVVLPAPAEKLFAMYMDKEQHSAFTGATVLAIGDECGSEFRAFDGMLWGVMFQVVKPRLIVQSWRSISFKGEDRDSTLVLSFSPEGDEGRIDLVHVNVPEHDYYGISEGWKKRYWEPWRAYLLSR